MACGTRLRKQRAVGSFGAESNFQRSRISSHLYTHITCTKTTPKSPSFSGFRLAIDFSYLATIETSGSTRSSSTWIRACTLLMSEIRTARRHQFNVDIPLLFMHDGGYSCRVDWSPEDGEYVGLCVEYPSLSWLAKTSESALEGIRKVVGEVVADLHACDPKEPALRSSSELV